MSVFSFDTHHSPSHQGLQHRPLALAGLRQVRWAMVSAVAVNVALWAGIAFGVSALVHI
jgi:hypothetical protein